MPFIFLHGVNTRKGTGEQALNYLKRQEERDELIKRLVLEPLASQFSELSKMELISPYWGDLGVHFSWNQQSLPDVSIFEHLGVEQGKTPRADQTLQETVQRLKAENQAEDPTALPRPDFQSAAMQDLPQFMEAVVAPLILQEAQLFQIDGNKAPQAQARDSALMGRLTALLLVAVNDVSTDAAAQAKVSQFGTDAEMLEYLKSETEARFKALTETAQEDVENEQKNSGKELLGGTWFSGLWDKVTEVFDRAKGAPARAATVSALDLFRAGAHGNISRFVGDVFVYLDERSRKEKPFLIVDYVRAEIRAARDKYPQEPLILLTHSMGGNVLYDILTFYDKDLRVDFWASVGGQVGLFEEMKIFRSSVPTVVGPAALTLAQPPASYWVNMYDPADIFSFRAKPVFGTMVHDEVYLTGSSTLDAHSAYFLRPSFYTRLRSHLETAMQSRKKAQGQRPLNQNEPHGAAGGNI